MYHWNVKLFNTFDGTLLGSDMKAFEKKFGVVRIQNISSFWKSFYGVFLYLYLSLSLFFFSLSLFLFLLFLTFFVLLQNKQGLYISRICFSGRLSFTTTQSANYLSTIQSGHWTRTFAIQSQLFIFIVDFECCKFNCEWDVGRGGCGVGHTRRINSNGSSQWRKLDTR